MSLKLPPTVIAFYAGVTLAAAAQSPSVNGNHAFAAHAEIEQGQNGQVIIKANSPRPLLQAITSVRRRYGWVLDYEEGRYPASQLITDSEGRPRLRGGTFQVGINPPKSVGAADEGTFLNSMINQTRASNPFDVSVRLNSSSRYTITGQNGVEPLMLDTPVQLPRATRTISDTVDTILALVSQQRGIPLVRGGVVDNGLLQSTVNMGSGVKTPARDLLTQALDAGDIARVWTQTYEPSDGTFAIGIELAVRTETDSTGEVKVTPIRNTATSLLNH